MLTKVVRKKIFFLRKKRKKVKTMKVPVKIYKIIPLGTTPSTIVVYEISTDNKDGTYSKIS